MLIGNQKKENEMNGICLKYGKREKCVEDTWTYFVDRHGKRITLQRIFKTRLELWSWGFVWINLTLDKDKTTACFEYSNGPSSSIK